MQRKTKPNKKQYNNKAFESDKQKGQRKVVSRNNQKVAMRLEYLKWN